MNNTFLKLQSRKVFHLFRSRSGQAITEVILGLTIATIIIGSAALAIALILRSNKTSTQFQAANFLAQEYLDEVEVISQGDWNDIYTQSSKGSSTKYMVIASGTELVVIGGTEGVVGDGVSNGLVGHWGLDETTSTTVYDMTGNGSNGTASGTPVATSSCKVGGCFDFYKVGVEIAASSSLENLDAFTASFWMYADTFGGFNEGTILDKAGAATNDDFRLRLYDAEDKFFFDAFRWDTDGLWESGNNTISAGSWKHVAVTYDYSDTANDAQVYIDGSPVQTAAFTNPAGSKTAETSDIVIGNSYDYTYYFDGRIDDVRMYNRVLSASEVNQIAQSTNYSRWFTIKNICRDASTDDITGETDTDGSTQSCTGAGGEFDPSTQKITVYIEWTERGDVQQLSSAKYITRWSNRTLKDTDWSGGPGEDGPLTRPGSQFSTSTNIDYTSSSGSIISEGY